MSDSGRISPTAHYTGEVWARNGLSHPALRTMEGRALFESLQPTMTMSRLIGGGTLEAYLLARHRAIDAALEEAIAERGVSQVVEVACGFSPRGWRFASVHGEGLTYVEADLPDMAERKRRALESMGSLSAHHRVVALDALQDRGPESIDALADELDPAGGLALLTEGLLGYLERDAVLGLWRRFAGVLARFPSGVYISDLHLGRFQNAQVRAFRVALSAFVRGRVHMHFDDEADALAALRGCGFTSAAVRPAHSRGDSAARRAHIIVASIE